jgi:hypothetical protein
MPDVPTPRGSVRVSDRQALRARDRLHRLPVERRAFAGDKARAVLERRDSRKAAAIVAAAAALAALAIPSVVS